jgi:hypothetical protein
VAHVGHLPVLELLVRRAEPLDEAALDVGADQDVVGSLHDQLWRIDRFVAGWVLRDPARPGLGSPDR